jgi:hypothetical protein
MKLNSKKKTHLRPVVKKLLSSYVSYLLPCPLQSLNKRTVVIRTDYAVDIFPLLEVFSHLDFFLSREITHFMVGFYCLQFPRPVLYASWAARATT